MRSIFILLTAAGLLVAAVVGSSSPSSMDKFLVELTPGEAKWVTRDEKMKMVEEHKRFFDITRHGMNIRPVHLDRRGSGSPNYPTKPAQVNLTNWAISQIEPNDLIPDVEVLTSFYNRYSESRHGVEAAEWIYERARNLFEEKGIPKTVVSKFQHSNSSQFTTIATIQGSSDKTIVIAAHIDSIDKSNPTGPAPGADDNASGVSVTLAALETLLKSRKIHEEMQHNTIEFHWYAGHETGKFGAAEVWAEYATQNRQVKAMLDQDVLGYFKPGTREEFGMITDFVNPELNEFLKMIINTYTSIPFITFDCGFACGDHGAPFKYGFPSAKVLESAMPNANPYIHTTEDTAGKLIYPHMYEHYKLVMGYLIELAFVQEL